MWIISEFWRQGSLTPKQINFFHSERMDQQTAYWSADGRMDVRTTKQTTGQKEKDKGRWTNRWTDRWLTEKTVRQPVKITANTNYPRANFFRCAKPPKHLHHTNLGGNSATASKKSYGLIFFGGFFLEDTHGTEWCDTPAIQLLFALSFFFSSFFFLLLFLLIYFSGTWRVWEGKAVWELFTLSMWCERIYLESLRSLAFLSIYQ